MYTAPIDVTSSRNVFALWIYMTTTWFPVLILCLWSRFPVTARLRSPGARGNPLRPTVPREARGGGGGGEEVGEDITETVSHVLPWIITPFSHPYFFIPRSPFRRLERSYGRSEPDRLLDRSGSVSFAGFYGECQTISKRNEDTSFCVSTITSFPLGWRSQPGNQILIL